ncbi:MAG: hypothetical protein ABI744_04710 [Chloroflexota bacterium]
MVVPASANRPPEPPRTLRLQLWWTLVLVLAALGGAGLAVGADRPGNPVQRPELTYRADTAAQPWIDLMTADLDTVQAGAADLASAGRNVLGSLQALDRAGAASALAAGDQTSAAIATLAIGLRDTENRAHASVDRWRLGPAIVGLFDQIDTAIAATEDLSTEWNALATTGHYVISVLEGLDGHDQATFQATQAGRDSRFTDALALLNDSVAQALLSVGTARDQLALTGDVSTLDDLVARDRVYDAALVALYQYLADGGAQATDQFTALTNAVSQAQAALPADNGVLIVIVGETCGLPIADELLAMDKSHGVINDALEAVSDAKTGGQGTDTAPLETQAPTDTTLP